MEFNSISYLIFLPIVMIIYYIIPCTFRYIWLLISSYYFYIKWNPFYVIILFAVTLLTYITGLILANTQNKNRKLLIINILMIVISLLFFKYSNLILSLFNINKSIILPIGISFYSFQAISYIVDVYRDNKLAEKNFFKYALYISFFPQIIAGPIERSSKLIHQFDNERKLEFKNVQEGIYIIVWGFFLKMVIADRLKIFVDAAYANITSTSGIILLIASIFFLFEIYCDFYGYSTIAIGSAKLFGIDLTENFKSPFFSKSIKEFWSRWHITLSSWLKDYIYIPLGGKNKKYLNLIIVFFISGMWHGAGLTFIIWGLLNAVYQIIEKKFNIKLNSFIIFLLITFSFIFFRADNFLDALLVIKNFIVHFRISSLTNNTMLLYGLDLSNIILSVILIIFLLVIDYIKYKNIVIRTKIMNQNIFIRWSLLLIAIIAIIIFGIWGGTYNPSEFIYSQF